MIPGPSFNVREMGVTDSTVKLMWSPPSELGIPTISYYHVVMAPPLPSDVVLTTTTTLIIRGIILSITYNFIVVPVAIGDTIGLLFSLFFPLCLFVVYLKVTMFRGYYFFTITSTKHRRV